jgi:hypothetical protein
MLRLIKPSSKGQGTDPPQRRRRSPDLTPDERRLLRQALHNLRFALGGWDVVALVTDLRPQRLYKAARFKNPAGGALVALRAARAAGTTVEHILSGKIAPAGRCPTCGRSQEARGAR